MRPEPAGRADFLLIRSRSSARWPGQWPATCIMLDMRLSARADYALRAAVELAAADGGHITAEQLARAQHIPGKFLEAILTQLRRAGLVRSQRGPEGGFWLAKPAAEIALADIIRAIDGQLVGVRGERPENIGYIGVAEPLQSVWIALRANERAILEEVTLEHIATGRAAGADRRADRRPPGLGLTHAAAGTGARGGPYQARARPPPRAGAGEPAGQAVGERKAGAVPPPQPPSRSPPTPGRSRFPLTPAPCR